jgi:hypothetical protein
LFCTGNESVEAAISYVFTNLLQEDNDDGNVVQRGAFAENNYEDIPKRYKMTFVVNTSLKMGVGKIAAQVIIHCGGESWLLLVSRWLTLVWGCTEK